MNEDSLKVSAFGGAHAFVFKAKVSDSTMNGNFYSGNHFKEPFIGVQNEMYELPNADSLTFLKKGYDKLAFSFLSAKGDKYKMFKKDFDVFVKKLLLK